DESLFRAALSQNLTDGRFRLVFVLDSAPEELVALAAFLEAISDKLVIDLVGVSSFDVGGSQIIVPQRITPESKQVVLDSKGAERRTVSSGAETPGTSEFLKSIETSGQDVQAALVRLVKWAESLETEGLARLTTYAGKGFSLLPRVATD